MGAQPKVSVIIPVYNTEKYLRECLDSLVNQTLKDIEIICVDDGSTDGSLAILREYEKMDPRVCVIAQKNSGASCARNVGLRHASGLFVCFVDSDDYVERDMLAVLLQTKDAQNADIIVFGGKSFPLVDWIDQRLTIQKKTYISDPIQVFLNESGSRPFAWNKLYRRSLLVENNCFFPEGMVLGEDTAFLFAVFPRAKCISFVPHKFYHYRQFREDSAMVLFAQDRIKKLQAHLDLSAHILNLWKQTGDFYGHEGDWANWCLNFLYSDILAAPFDQKHSAAQKVISFMDDKCVSGLDPRNQERYDTLLSLCAPLPETPAISIIMPVYNTAVFLPQCLDSLMNQTFENFELICVDDGSQDRSVEVLESYASHDQRISILHQHHQYAGAARNRGIEVARGEYLLFLDSDDFFEPNMLESIFLEAKKYDADICAFRARSYDHPSGKYIDTPWTCNTDRCPKNETFSAEDNAKYIFAFTTAAPWSKLFRKDFILQENIRFQSVRSSNDVVFVLLALASAKRIIAMDACLLNYRVNAGQSLQSTKHKDPLAFYAALCELKRELIARNLYDLVEQSFILFALDCCLFNLNTIKEKAAFEHTYFFLRDTAFPALDVNGHGDDYFYAYRFNDLYNRRNDVNTLPILEFVEKYKLFSPPSTPLTAVNPTEKDRRQEEYARQELQRVYASWSFRIGHFITFIPRKLRGGIRCYKEHGLRYTLRRIKEKLGL